MKGKIEEKIEIAKNLLNQKIDIDIIVISTGLTVEEIEKLR
jgi:predicted transposase/invertase (TIGR01784 family)